MGKGFSPQSQTKAGLCPQIKSRQRRGRRFNCGARDLFGRRQGTDGQMLADMVQMTRLRFRRGTAVMALLAAPVGIRRAQAEGQALQGAGREKGCRQQAARDRRLFRPVPVLMTTLPHTHSLAVTRCPLQPFIRGGLLPFSAGSEQWQFRAHAAGPSRTMLLEPAVSAGNGKLPAGDGGLYVLTQKRRLCIRSARILRMRTVHLSRFTEKRRLEQRGVFSGRITSSASTTICSSKVEGHLLLKQCALQDALLMA